MDVIVACKTSSSHFYVLQQKKDGTYVWKASSRSVMGEWHDTVPTFSDVRHGREPTYIQMIVCALWQPTFCYPLAVTLALRDGRAAPHQWSLNAMLKDTAQEGLTWNQVLANIHERVDHGSASLGLGRRGRDRGPSAPA